MQEKQLEPLSQRGANCSARGRLLRLLATLAPLLLLQHLCCDEGRRQSLESCLGRSPSPLARAAGRDLGAACSTWLCRAPTNVAHLFAQDREVGYQMAGDIA
jgi:hypothetical protein